MVPENKLSDRMRVGVIRACDDELYVSNPGNRNCKHCDADQNIASPETNKAKNCLIYPLLSDTYYYAISILHIDGFQSTL